MFQIINNLITKEHADLIKSEICNFFVVKEYYEIEQALDAHDLHEARIHLNQIQAIIDLGDLLLPQIEESLNCKLKKHPVSGVRIVTKDQTTQTPWHQDEGTWCHKAELSNLSPITCWIPLIATNNNTLELTSMNPADLFPHFRDELGRAYCNLPTNLSTKTFTISPILGNGYLFDSLHPHKSFFNPLFKNDTVRISVDFRYYKFK